MEAGFSSTEKKQIAVLIGSDFPVTSCERTNKLASRIIGHQCPEV